MMRLASLATACNGKLEGADVAVLGVAIDSRGDCTDRLFIALKGENFDAHDYLEQAALRGATAVMIERDVNCDLPTVKVESCHQALKDIAGWWRAQFVVPVVGITGSVGKTTVKEMTAAVFSGLGSGLVTKGNQNNEIGVPLTLLRFADQDRYAIIEMGMNHAGEISRLTQLVRPTVALINNAAAAHLEALGTVAAVAKAKGEILAGLHSDGVAVINADDRHAQLWLDLAAPRRTLTFGLDHDADVMGRCELFVDHSVLQVEHLGEECRIRLAVPGKHNVMNALAVVAIARAANVGITDLIHGLENYRPISGRLNIKQVGKLTLIDDTYNSNPASMAAAIDVLVEYQNTTLIMGDMGELGEAAGLEHERIGQLATSKGVDQVLACGTLAQHVVDGLSVSGRGFATQKELLEYLSEQPIVSGAVLVKGSRSAHMERVVDCLLAAVETQSQRNLTDGVQ